MKVLFLNPPSYKGFDGGAGARYQARREIRSFWYPVWLAVPAGLVEGSRLIDAPPAGMGLEEVVREAAGYDLIVMHTSTPTLSNDCAAAQRLKESYPGVLIGFVGPHAMTLPGETLLRSPAIDFVCTGEFDYAIKEIAQGMPLEKVHGLMFRVNGGFTRTPDRPLMARLDDLPFATKIYARDLKIEHYYNGYLEHPYMAIHGGRGCNARCTFCLWPQTIGGRHYRTRSVENVMEEVEQARGLFPQVREFFFDDDTFTGNLSRAGEIARRVGKLGIKWSANARANVPYKSLKVMRENGLNLLTVGFESGSEQILRNINKGITIEGAKQFARACRELGILVHAAFILGLPGETAETIKQTIEYAKELDPYSIQVSLPAPYPGTELYAQAVKEGWLKKEDLNEDGIQNAVLSYEHLSRDEIFDAVELFYRRFYFRPRPILRILGQMLTDAHVFKRRAREGLEFFSFMARRKDVCE
ncbi:MAG: hopanoid biosynthesis associated radical SAM protein HpnJ [Nitrospiraceae bacterium]|nr:hopanoid biosynthesis associated radical SAM protein HpnJ [Nitrospiraceae bacterium]